MTHFLRDILRQPEELRRTIEFVRGGEGRRALDAAADAIRGVRHVYLTGIGSSWHAALNVSALFSLGTRPVYMQDAAEMVQFAAIPRDAVLIVISRSGRSVEIVQLLVKARDSGAKVIGITNVVEGTLAREAQIPIVVPVELDHAISVNTYSTLALAAGLLAFQVIHTGEEKIPQGLKPSSEAGLMSELKLRPPKPALRPPKQERDGAQEEKPSTGEATSGSVDVLVDTLSGAIAEAGRAIPKWQEQIEKTSWLAAGRTTYFLARGTSLGSCYEARLLWEEGVKSPATAMGTGSFRHGPQEMIAKEMRFGIWIDGVKMREQDLAVARDLRTLGAKVMLIGQNLPDDAGDLVMQLPAIPAEWQFLVDMIPVQLAAERLARLAGADSDTFRLVSFVVEDEAGLLPKVGRK